MYTAASGHSARNGAAFAGAYRQTSLHTGVGAASPHRLVTMLFDGIVEDLALAKGAIAGGDRELKAKALARAVRIVDEGLRSALNLQQGGALARDLHDLYAYITARLTHANLKNDEGALEECAALMTPVREAWASIRTQADALRGA
jgi:flagellar protein FliS